MEYEKMLTKGTLLAIMNNEEIKDPIMQVLGVRKITAAGANERYRLLISDGQNLNSFAMLATQLNSMILSGELTEFAIVKIKRHIISNLTDRSKGSKQVMILIDLVVMVPGNVVSSKIGDPKPIVDNSGHMVANGTSAPAVATPKPQSNSVKMPTVQSSVINNGLQSVIDVDNIHPINSLSPYQNKWTIRARVVCKTPIRTWSNQRGDGKLFSMDLVDESSEIRATAFNNECDKFFDMIEVNKVYFITRGAIKTANKKFTNLDNDYELTFSSETQIFPCHDFDDSQMPAMKFNFTQLSQVKDMDVDSIVDIIGVCQNAGDVTNLVSKTTRKELQKRDVTLVDQSLSSVTATLWGTQATDFDGSLQPVIAIKGSRIREFMGSKSLSLLGSTIMQINPDIEEAHRLRGWYDSLPSNVEFNSISTRSDGGINTKFLTIKGAQLAQLGSGDKADYYNMYSHLIFVKSESALYKACPKPDCQKKVIDRNDGTYRCEKCNDETENFKYRLMLQAQLSDSTGNQWVTMFQEAAETLLGTTSTELGRLMEEAKEEYCDVFQKQMFKLFDARARAKMETYNNETRLKVSIVNMKPIDYKIANEKLIADIKRLSGIST
ncbi:Nucleic acid-binding, OB-fold,Replication factor-A protein 1, N-terminal,Replication factor A, C- [Cinara cedri]|uniref:Replication protein A subunit n=1 Tax=Cinara cedri TaxID=506608 RepID=A0A5E4NGG0_9HEMI|nr:Nucleic acid-binding, OB-fold,Replication factor-A protein 1, N-terminal,Replication factor A, C- [Cinara cedri]